MSELDKMSATVSVPPGLPHLLLLSVAVGDPLLTPPSLPCSQIPSRDRQVKLPKPKRRKISR